MLSHVLDPGDAKDNKVLHSFGERLRHEANENKDFYTMATVLRARTERTKN